ncbi:unnamed protein product, partial [Bubo scandiacus]
MSWSPLTPALGRPNPRLQPQTPPRKHLKYFLAFGESSYLQDPHDTPPRHLPDVFSPLKQISAPGSTQDSSQACPG